ncbi:MAG: hypothetical protein L0G99_04455 [Propionibacteriales bacterium]|nr:hypothetical protein [Propionibacteriales bacterium]
MSVERMFALQRQMNRMLAGFKFDCIPGRPRPLVAISDDTRRRMSAFHGRVALPYRVCDSTVA